MTVERAVRMIAGVFVLLRLHSDTMSILTGTCSPPSSALNLFESAFTNWCPMMTILRSLG